MGINRYKIYSSSSISTIDMTIIEPGIRWNYDNTQFLIEFIEMPDEGIVTMDLEETLQIISQFPWDWDTGD